MVTHFIIGGDVEKGVGREVPAKSFLLREHKLFSFVIFGQKCSRLAVLEPKLPTCNSYTSLPAHVSWTHHSPLKFIFSHSSTCRVYSKKNSNTLCRLNTSAMENTCFRFPTLQLALLEWWDRTGPFFGSIFS